MAVAPVISSYGRSQRCSSALTLVALAIIAVLVIADFLQHSSCKAIQASAALPPATRNYSGNAAQRLIVDNVWASLGEDLRSRSVTSAIVIAGDCKAPPVSAAASALKGAGVTLHCVSTLSGVVTSLGDPNSKLGRLVAGSGGAQAAVLRVTQQSADAAEPTGVAANLLAAQLMYSGFGGLRAYVEAVVDEKGGPRHAALLDLKTSERRLLTFRTQVHRDTFNTIYGNMSWGAEGGGSGSGSTLPRTAKIRKALPDIIRKYGITSMMDTSCGSMLWMPLVLREVRRERPDFRFFGSDVVCNLIDRHKTTFANETNWDFRCIDYAHEPLPQGYDLVWSRDSLQHVPLHSAWQFLNNVKSTGARYLLVGSYIDHPNPNKNVPAGGYYDVDLLKPPFNVRPKPVEVIEEHSTDNKHMLLFDLRKMRWDDELTSI